MHHVAVCYKSEQCVFAGSEILEDGLFVFEVEGVEGDDDEFGDAFEEIYKWQRDQFEDKRETAPYKSKPFEEKGYE